ncbi:MAG: 50S ribosomal protein L4 [Clostridiales bacterium]|nr:50S ribosomal protein L4 [Clostridiales bacterium]
MAKLNVYNMKKESVGSIDLNDLVFGAEYNEALIHQVVVALHNNARQGTKSTLTRSEINATKKKIYRQKGTGNARHDEKSAPQFVGGGVVFAPKPRDFSQKINKKMRDIAFSSALSQKIRQEEVFILDEVKFADNKTKAASEFLKTFGLNKRTIIVTDGKDEGIVKATGNIQKVSCEDVMLLNVTDVVENTFLVFTKNAIKKLEEAYV